MANGSQRHADAAMDRILDESERRQREFAELLKDVEDDEEDSTVGLAAVEQLGRVAMASQHDRDVPDSTPPGMPWHVRVLPKPLRWIAALVVIAAAVVALFQAITASHGPK